MGSRSRRSSVRKVKLSYLVLKYLQEGRLTYAIVLTIAAKRPVSRKEMFEIANIVGEDLDISTLKSWLYYQTLRKYLEKTGVHGQYKIGSVIDVDYEDTKKLLEDYGIDIDSIEESLRNRFSHTIDKHVEEIIEQVLHAIKDVIGNIELYYIVKCNSKRYLIPVKDYELRKIGDEVIIKGQKCTIVGINITRKT